MKKNTPYTCHTKKLMLASLISMVMVNHAQAQNDNPPLLLQNYVSEPDAIYITDAHYNNSVILEDQTQKLFISNSQLDAGIRYLGKADLEGDVKDSTFSGQFFVQSTEGSVSLSLNNVDVTIDNILHSDVLLYAQENASLDLMNSRVATSVHAYGSEGTLAKLQISGSRVGNDDDNFNGYRALVQNGVAGESNSHAAELDISNSQIYGSVLSSSMDRGTASIALTNGSVIKGDADLNGSVMLLSIDDATLTGDIHAGSYTELPGDVVSTTVNVTNAVYRGNITSNNNIADDSLTININSSGIIGGETVDSSQRITGFNHVDANINYVDTSLLNTGKASYFFFNDGEDVVIANKVGANTVLDSVRSGSYILDHINYQITDESSKQGLADKGYYSIVFNTASDPVPDPTPDATVAADLQAAQAGLLASDDMIHRIAGSITQHLDARHMGENGAQTSDSNVWMDGIYSGGDRTAGTVEYSNDISGFQLGGDTSWALSNGDSLAIGAGLGYLHNDLDVSSSDGSNDIDGNYYSLYASWTQHQAEGQNWHLFADTTATYGDMSYSASGKDGTLNAGGDYDGNSWLWQARVGAQVNLAQDWWVQPYTVLGYSQTKTDAYNDGYSQVADGKFSAGFAGAGVKAGKTIELKGGQTLRPYIETSYVGRFSEDTKFNTSDYHFSGQNLNGGSVGAGLNAQLSKNWSTTAKVNTVIASDVSNEVHALLGAEYKF
ncbi:autotransporter outer membrane beta-barrel domain-containing protein [Rahnella sp. AA]|uniref:autotransporter outer membrane beta-barrel domain-containing protein n=1 Tax=Rahnella sp. AA TaxID=2057180 RepID=UPI000C33F661|nr:autotransporter outer membrane beta-barrel domain-containing protein [Rahnella sp. AA]PKE29402.1 autotransporter outer membrane beta-barrel domain-containing protein [Rahnella sp. AA]